MAASEHGDTAAPTDVATRLLGRLADRFGGRASVTAVFGEPVVHGDVAVIPVARVGFGFGGGAGNESGKDKDGSGGGGAGVSGASALGFIEITNGSAVYRPIRDPWLERLVLAAVLVVGVVVPIVSRRLDRHRCR